MHLTLIALMSSALISNVLALGTLQSAAVMGKLLCDGKPYKDAKVKLYDVDFADPDDLMAESRSGQDGKFSLQGSETEVTRIDVKLNIYHNCNDEQKECLRKIQIRIPDDFVAEGPYPKKTFDVGELNLNGVYPGESRDCIN